MNATILYFSSSGNTAALADRLAHHLRQGGARVLLTSLEDVRPSDVADADVVLIGSPAWTGESVVPAVEHFIREATGQLAGKRVGFFGCYDWGEGQYFDSLMAYLRGAGVELHDSVLVLRGGKGQLDEKLVATFAGDFCSQSPSPPTRV